MFSNARALSVCLVLLVPLAAQRDLTIQRIGIQAKRALVIGNSAYPQSPLKNPANDASRMTSVLRSLGFEVLEGRDLNKRGMDELIDSFAARLKPGDLALFYYAGHGVQIDQENYLVPLDYKPTSETDLKYSSYSAALARDKMEASGARLRGLILDACRNNPFHRKRGGPGGLAAMSSDAVGTLIVFAASDNQVADDNPEEGNGRSGPTRGACLTCSVTYGNGPPIGTIPSITRPAKMKISKVRRKGSSVCCGAVPATIISAYRAVSVSNLASMAPVSAGGVPGNYPDLYLSCPGLALSVA